MLRKEELVHFLAIFSGLFVLSICLTGLFRRYALKKELMDHPNHRSSHREPTPRGGGIVFVMVSLAAFLWACEFRVIPSNIFKIFALPAFMIAVLGYCDDVKGLSAKLRLAIQVAAAVIFLYSIQLSGIGFGTIQLLMIIGAVVWSTNLYNFMDGTDGLAAIEALTVYGIGGLLLWHYGAHSLALLAGIIVAAVGGFLVWNWPKARIFMGDSGSLFLGFLIIPIALVGNIEYGLSCLVWVMLYLFFFMDATLTLLRRLIHREKWYEAHRLHAYQRLHQAGYSHSQILWIAIGLNSTFALLALLVAFSMVPVFLGLLAAVTIYLIFYVFVEFQLPMYSKPCEKSL